MTFDLKTFKDNVKEFVRTANFHVLIEDANELSFLISKIEIREDRVILTITEQETFDVWYKIRMWEKDNNILDLHVQIFNPAGDHIKTLDGVIYPDKMSYKTILDWNAPNSLMSWEVTFPVAWRPLK